MFILARPIDGVSINGKEFLLDDSGKAKLFHSHDEVVEFCLLEGIPLEYIEEDECLPSELKPM